MIDRLLLAQELKRQGFVIAPHATDEQIDAAIKDQFHSDRQRWLTHLQTGCSDRKILTRDVFTADCADERGFTEAFNPRNPDSQRFRPAEARSCFIGYAGSGR